MQLTCDHAVVDGLRIAYRDEGDGEPVVLIHGTPAYSLIWREVYPRLRAAGHRVLAYDLAGYGYSERPHGDCDTGVSAQADLLRALLATRGAEHATLVGHDIGGAVTQVLAVDHPTLVRRAALVDSVSYDSWPSSTWREILADYPDGFAGLPDAEYEQILQRQLRATVADPDRMTGSVLNAYLAPLRGTVGRASFYAHQLRHYESSTTQRAAASLAALALPVLVLWGTHDRWQPVSYAHRLANDIPGAELQTIPGAGHFVTEDAPEQVATALIDFLDRT